MRELLLLHKRVTELQHLNPSSMFPQVNQQAALKL